MYRFPTGWLDRVTADYRYTKDIADLELLAGHYLFVYDNMKTGHRQASVLAGAELKGEVLSRDPYSVFVRNLGANSYPLPLARKYPGLPHSRILGELYFVDTKTLVEIDNLRRNGVEFTRQRVISLFPFKERWLDNETMELRETRIRYFKVEAWMYIGNKIFWHNLLDNGLLFGVCSHSEFENGPPTDEGRVYSFEHKDYFNGDSRKAEEAFREDQAKVSLYLNKKRQVIEDLKQASKPGSLSALRSGWKRLWRG